MKEDSIVRPLTPYRFLPGLRVAALDQVHAKFRGYWAILLGHKSEPGERQTCCKYAFTSEAKATKYATRYRTSYFVMVLPATDLDPQFLQNMKRKGRLA